MQHSTWFLKWMLSHATTNICLICSIKCHDKWCIDSRIWKQFTHVTSLHPMVSSASHDATFIIDFFQSNALICKPWRKLYIQDFSQPLPRCISSPLPRANTVLLQTPNSHKSTHRYIIIITSIFINFTILLPFNSFRYTKSHSPPLSQKDVHSSPWTSDPRATTLAETTVVRFEWC